MSTIGEKKQVSNENQAQNSIVEDARLYPEARRFAVDPGHAFVP